VRRGDSGFRPTRRAALQSLLLASLAPPAFAQTRPGSQAVAWPTQPVKLLIGFPGGSVQDLSARAIAPGLGAVLGQPVIVDNRAGASGTIAADLVAKAADGHTFGVMNNSQLTVAKLLSPKIGYDPARDLAPIALRAASCRPACCHRDSRSNRRVPASSRPWA
jgi:tripartite-type tricarboxylate transporter receptor subunit TctC